MKPTTKSSQNIAKPLPVFLQQFVRHSSDAVFLIDQNQNVLAWNEPLEHLSGFLGSYAQGRQLRELLPGFHPQDLQSAIAQLEEGNPSVVCSFQLSLAGGGAGQFQVHLFPVPAPACPFLAIAGMLKASSVHLPSGNKQPEKEMDESKLFAEKVADGAPCIITVFDLEQSRHVYFNRQIETLTGFAIEEVQALGAAVLERLIHPDDLEMLTRHMALIATLPDGGVKELEYRVKNKQGQWRWFQVRGSVFKRNENGAATQLLAVLIDIEEPRQSRQLLSQVLSDTRVGIMALEAAYENEKLTDFRFTYLNGRAAGMLAVQNQALLGESLRSFLEKTGHGHHFRHFASVIDSGQPLAFEKQVATQGPARWLSVTVAPMAGGLTVSLTDITTQKNIEAELNTSRDFIRKITNTMPSQLYVYKVATGGIVFSNTEVYDRTANEQSSSLNYPGFLARNVHPEDLDALMQHHQAVFSGSATEAKSQPFRLLHPNGRYCWSVSYDRIFSPGPDGSAELGISVIQNIDELKRSKRLLNGVLNQTQNMILAFESVRDQHSRIVDFTYIHANATSEKFTGMAPQELVGASLRKYMTGELAGERFNWYVRVVEEGSSAEFEQFFDLPVGPTWFHISAVKMDDGFVATFSEITRRKLVEKELSESREFIQKITDAAPLIITVFDLEEKKFVFRNKQLAEMTGYTATEAAMMDEHEITALIHPDDLNDLPQHYRKLAELPDGEVAEYRFRAKDKTGNYRQFIARDSVFRRTPDGEIAAILGVTQDMHELQRSKEMLASVLDSSMSVITVLQAKRNARGEIVDFIYLLRNSAPNTKKTSEIQFGTDTIHQKWPFLQYDDLFKKMIGVVETGNPYHLEYYYHAGLNAWIEISITRLGDGIVVTYADVSLRKMAEDEIRKSEALLSQAQQIANLGIWEWDIAKDKIFWSDSLYDMFELSRDVKDISLETYLNLLDAEESNEIRAMIERSFRTREDFTFPHSVKYKGGRVKHFIGKGRLLLDADSNPVRMLGTAMDVTEMIEMRQRLNEMMQVKSLGEAIPQIIWTATPAGHTNYVNQRWFEFTGLEEAKMMSGAWINLIHPNDAKTTSWNWKKSLVTGRIFEHEFRMLRQDGVYRWLLARAVPMIDESGKIVKWFGASTDIDDQKKTMEAMEQIQDALSHYNTELSQKNQELRQTNTDLDNFIYTASHDLKAPISNIEGLLDLLKSEVKTDDGLAGRIFNLMDKSIARFKNTLKDLTDISSTDRHQNEAVSELYLPDLMDEVEADIDMLIKESKAIIRFNFEVNQVLYSRKNMRSILYNLLSNALKYRSPDRIPEIVLCSKQLQKHIVEITVTDNGLGLDEKDTERVFEMFRRAHSHVEGSGVGLYIVKRIVENSGGNISVESTLGHGTTFKVLLKQ